MQPNLPGEGLLARTIPLSPRLEARLACVADAHTGGLTGIDVRLYRRLATPAANEAFAPTAAGFRVPMHAARAIAHALLSIADTLKLP